MARTLILPSRGYCGIGMENPKTGVNLGTLWRSAHCLGADFIFTIGDRYKGQASDTTKAYRHVPYWRFTDWADFAAHVPYDCRLVGVEITSKSVGLPGFKHPERAIYLLGPEDGSLSAEAQARCDALVQFQSAFCLNVATAGSIVLYDRQAKRLLAEAA
jgi:tRNA G18 (ribose-2'-O)-methylase SpoU